MLVYITYAGNPLGRYYHLNLAKANESSASSTPFPMGLRCPCSQITAQRLGSARGVGVGDVCLAPGKMGAPSSNSAKTGGFQSDCHSSQAIRLVSSSYYRLKQAHAHWSALLSCLYYW